MKKGYSVLIVWFMLASCKVIDEKISPCFSCSVAGKDSCSMIDSYGVFACKKKDTTETINFSRCGAGMLTTVRFNYSGNSDRDSAVVKVLADSSALHIFPVKLPAATGDCGYIEPSIQYKKDGYFELPLPAGISFGQSCTVSFSLRSGADPRNVKNSVVQCFQNIFLQWIPKLPTAPKAGNKAGSD